MILITSGAYVSTEMQVEFGKLPPAFLPLGSKKLFEQQIRCLRKQFKNDDIFISIPENFKVSEADWKKLEKLGATIIRVEEDLTLGESIISAVEQVENPKKIRILHGDTLLNKFPQQLDVIGVARTQDFYDWEIERVKTEEELVWCGYFAFTDVSLLVDSFKRSNGKFVEGVNIYNEKRDLCRTTVSTWHDLGHTNNYYKTRASITTQRAFNELKIEKGVVYKTGEPAKKIAAEANWYSSLPVNLKRYAPQLIDTGRTDTKGYYYVIEYLYQVPLNELYVHGKNPSFYWKRVFSKCNEWLELCHQEVSTEKKILLSNREKLYKQKTLKRLRDYAEDTGTALDKPTSINGKNLPPILDIAEKCIEQALGSPFVLGVQHGDFCFSNILFDSRADVIKVIDPRGMNFDGTFTNEGDLLYDIAKLNHSVVGLYDFIISGAYSLEETKELQFNLSIHTEEELKIIQSSFLNETFVNQITPRDVMPHTVLLFLSMLPLHSDDRNRQRALLANALRLFEQYIWRTVV